MVNAHMTNRIALVVVLSLLAAAPAATAEDRPAWLGEDLPLPLTVKTPQDIAFKSVAERQYLIFNLLAGGKWAYQRGDYAGAVEKWEALLKTPGLDPQVDKVVAPLLSDARKRAAHGGGAPVAASAKVEHTVASAPAEPVAIPPSVSTTTTPPPARPARPAEGRTTVSGQVSGGGPDGPNGAVVWLRRLDGPMPKPAAAAGRFITQRDKTFLPHVLPVPVGTTVEFRNDDRIYHNVFSLNKPNDFDAGIRAAGSTYQRTFNKAGPVELLCNIHSTMNAYVVVIDSPYYTKVRPSGSFTIHGVWPGRYEVNVWHEASSAIVKHTITVPPGGADGVALTVNGDKHPGAFVPDKYGHKRQPHLGY
jgi:plastocyanin